MELEPKIIEALLAELQRQAETGTLKVAKHEEDAVYLEGPVRLDTLAMAVATAVAGGP